MDTLSLEQRCRELEKELDAREQDLEYSQNVVNIALNRENTRLRKELERYREFLKNIHDTTICHPIIKGLIKEFEASKLKRNPHDDVYWTEEQQREASK